SQACLETVSSCLIARVNALHKKVIISVRGESSCLFPLQPRVPVQTEYRETDGTKIPSLDESPCAPGTAAGDATRDCGWKARYVGSCTPGEHVSLTVGGNAMVRVCRGIYGCDHEDRRPLPGQVPPENPTPWYAGVIASSDASDSTMGFTCPQ